MPRIEHSAGISWEDVPAPTYAEMLAMKEKRRPPAGECPNLQGGDTTASWWTEQTATRRWDGLFFDCPEDFTNTPATEEADNG